MSKQNGNTTNWNLNAISWLQNSFNRKRLSPKNIYKNKKYCNCMLQIFYNFFFQVENRTFPRATKGKVYSKDID